MGCEVESEVFYGTLEDLDNYEVFSGIGPYYYLKGAKAISHHPYTNVPFEDVEWECPNIKNCRGCGYEMTNVCPHELAISVVGKWNPPCAIPIFDKETGERKYFILGISYPN